MGTLNTFVKAKFQQTFILDGCLISTLCMKFMIDLFRCYHETCVNFISINNDIMIIRLYCLSSLIGNILLSISKTTIPSFPLPGLYGIQQVVMCRE